jgi:hypothetical protein
MKALFLARLAMPLKFARVHSILRVKIYARNGIFQKNIQTEKTVQGTAEAAAD